MKKILLFVLIFLLSLSLFACGGDGSGDGTVDAMPTRYITGISCDVSDINLTVGEEYSFIVYLEDDAENADPNSALDTSLIAEVNNNCVEVNRDHYYNPDNLLEARYVVRALSVGTSEVVIRCPFNDASYTFEVVVTEPERVNADLALGENIFNGLAGATYTFTAPADGTLTLTGFTPDIGYVSYYYTINGVDNYLLSSDSQTDIELFADDVIVILCEGDDNADCNCILVASWSAAATDPDGPGEPSDPSDPADPGEPSDPTDPDEPADPGEPDGGDEDEEICSIGLSYELSADGEYYIVTGRGTCTDTEIIIPSKYNGLPVREIADRAFYTPVSDSDQHNSDITVSLTIPASVKRIGYMAFYYSSTLTNVVIYVEDGTFPVDGGNAFQLCQPDRYAIRTLDSVTFIGDFDVLSANVTWPAVYLYSAEYYSVTNLTFDGKIGTIESAHPCKNLTVTGGVDTVKKDAFSESSNGCYIQNINFNGVKTIEQRAFYGNTNIRTFNFDGLTSLGVSAFEQSSLGSANIPGTLTHIPKRAFYKSGLGSLTLGEGVISIDEEACMWSYVSYVNFGTTLTTIGANAFDSCSFSGTLTIPANVISIGNGAFSTNQGITSLVMLTPKDNMTRSVGNGAFYRCDYMTDVSVEGFTNYGSGVFESCYRLKRINFGIINVI
ncbi:MAG: leucine-rich repeat protein, partial [Clostridia bacterium]|nr:leucine-rich repeat protein [Clostridia bacterium]